MERPEGYNPFAERVIIHPTNDFETAVLIMKGAVGAGILAMPFAFAHIGLVMGLVGCLVVVVLISYSTHILVKSSQTLCVRHRIPRLNYAQTAERAFANENHETTSLGIAMFYIVNFFIVFNLLGVVSIYFINAGRNIEQVMNLHFSGLHLEIEEYILIMAIPMCVLSLIQELKYLARFSLVGNLIVAYVLIVTFTFMFDDLPPFSERPAVVSIEKWPTFLVIAFFGLQCIAYIIPIENEMKSPLHFTKCPSVFLYTMIVVGTTYTTIGFFGFYKYGASIQPNITLNLPVENIWAQSVKISIAIMLYLTSTIPFYVAVKIVWGGMHRNVPKSRHILYQRVIRIVILTMCTLIAMTFPNLGAVLSVVGALSLSFLGLLLPATIDIACRRAQGYGRFKYRLIIDIFLICFGPVVAVTGMIQSVREFNELVMFFSLPHPLKNN